MSNSDPNDSNKSIADFDFNGILKLVSPLIVKSWINVLEIDGVFVQNLDKFESTCSSVLKPVVGAAQNFKKELKMLEAIESNKNDILQKIENLEIDLRTFLQIREKTIMDIKDFI